MVVRQTGNTTNTLREMVEHARSFPDVRRLYFVVEHAGMIDYCAHLLSHILDEMSIEHRWSKGERSIAIGSRESQQDLMFATDAQVSSPSHERGHRNPYFFDHTSRSEKRYLAQGSRS